MILYTDPYDYSSPSEKSSYPDSWWLPGTGVQRGNVKMTGDGDPETQFYPSLGIGLILDINLNKVTLLRLACVNRSCKKCWTQK